MPPTLLICETSLPAGSVRRQRVICEYVAWLGLDLSHRGFEAEIADLNRTHTQPSGTFFLAEGGARAGSAKVRALGWRRPVLGAVPQTVHTPRPCERMGFEETAPCYGAVLPGTRFFAMTLR